MDLHRKALSILIIALGASAPALAQSGAALRDAALGGGLMLPKPGGESADGADPRFEFDARSASWWSPGVPDRRLDFGLTVAPRLGHSPSAGLYSAESRPSLDVGPGLRWRASFGTLTATYGLDPTGLSRGETVQLNFSRPVVSEQGFRMLAFVGAEWQSARAERVIFGPGDRLTPPVGTRPLYSSGAATNVGFGLDSYYQLTKSSAILVGASGLRLGGAPADGALYTNRWQAILYGGYSFRF